jgi:hypothetical protein
LLVQVETVFSIQFQELLRITQVAVEEALRPQLDLVRLVEAVALVEAEQVQDW